MLREWRDKWIAALRSGRYTQARGTLKETIEGKSSFCCMGVLCDVVAPDGWMPACMGSTVSAHKNDYSTSFPSHFVVQVTEFDRNQEQQLAMLNDSEMRSFSEIADWIEANL